MDPVQGLDLTLDRETNTRGEVNQNSWLMTYLLNGADSGYNGFGSNNDIRIVLDPKDMGKAKGLSKIL